MVEIYFKYDFYYDRFVNNNEDVHLNVMLVFFLTRQNLRYFHNSRRDKYHPVHNFLFSSVMQVLVCNNNLEVQLMN